MTIAEREDYLRQLFKRSAATLDPQAQNWLCPIGWEPFVQLRAAGRKKRSTAREDYWQPEDGEILIYFRPAAEPLPRTHELPQERENHPETPSVIDSVDSGREPQGYRTAAPVTEYRREQPELRYSTLPSLVSPGPIHGGQLAEPVPGEVVELLEELVVAEKRPMSFIGLIWFRDTFLKDHLAWFPERMKHLGWALDQGLIDKGEPRPNPKDPNRPTTTIVLSAEGRRLVTNNRKQGRDQERYSEQQRGGRSYKSRTN